MADIYEFVGREFDWFAIDSSRCIALFSTAGIGYIPHAVMNFFSEHDEISQSIDSPNWGSSSVWDDYAKLGLYVYDWHLNEGLYVRVRIPEIQAEAKLIQMVDSLVALPKFTGKFDDVQEFEDLGSWHDIDSQV